MLGTATYMAPEQLENHARRTECRRLVPRHRAARMSHRRAVYPAHRARFSPTNGRSSDAARWTSGAWKLLLTGCSRPRPRTASVRSTCRRCSRHRPSAPPGFDRPRRATSRQSSATRNIRADRTAKLPLGLRAPRQWRQNGAETDDKRSQRSGDCHPGTRGDTRCIGIAFPWDRRTLRHDDHSRADDDRSSFDDHDLAFDFALSDQDVNDVIADRARTRWPTGRSVHLNGAQQAVTTSHRATHKRGQ